MDCSVFYRSGKLSVTLLLLAALGCSGVHVKKYAGPVVSQQELALVFTSHIEGSQTKIYSLDAANLPYTMTRILELAPGQHSFEVFNSPWPQNKTGLDGVMSRYDLNPPREYAVYNLTAELKAGFTYVPVPAARGTLDAPAEQVCLAEEPHDSPAARVNISGELRYPGPDARLIGCSGRVPLPPGFNDRYPDSHRID